MESKKRIKTDEKSTTAELLENRFKDILNESELYLKYLTEWEKAHDSILNKIENSFSTAKKSIKLMVGGKLFIASKENLISIENTYFYGLIATSNKFKPEEDGSYFIERNPLVFDRILDYLRTGKLDIRDLSDYMLDMLLDDFDYYCIPLPYLCLVSWDVNRKSDQCSLFENNRVVIKTSYDDEWIGGVIGNKAVDRFTVKIINRGNNDSGENFLIGFTTGESWDPHNNFDQKGWFIFDNGEFDDEELYGGGDVYDDDTLKIKNGDYITVIREENIIRFEKNKICLELSIELTDIPDHPLFPALNIRATGAIISLDNYY